MHLWSGLVAGPLVLLLALSGAILVFAAEIDAATRRPGAVPERSALVPLRSLHASFHAGAPGTVVVGVLGLLLTAQGFTGLWLYGPALGRRAQPQSFHRVLGGLCLAFAALVGLTGMLLACGSVIGATDGIVMALLRHLHYGNFAGYWIVARRPD